MRTMITAIMAVGIFAVTAAAEEESGLGRDVVGGAEVDTSFEVTLARLSAEGFREVRMINSDPYRLGAFDPQGSEVRLLISPQTGDVDETIYEHPMDE